MPDNRSRALPPRRLPRQALAGALVAVCLPLAACGGGTSGTGGTAQPTTSPSGNATDTAMNIPMPSNIMNLPLIESTTGKKLSLASLKGKVIVINDVMTLCQETCPLDTANMVQAARAVEKAGLGDKVEFLSITIDPQRDTATQLAAYRDLFAPPPADWATVTGDPANLAALWKDLGVWTQKVAEGNPPAKNWLTGATLTYDLNHSDDVFFIDQNAHEQDVLDGPAHVVPGTQMPQKLNTFMDDDGHQNLAHPSSDAWTTQQLLRNIATLTHHPSIPLPQ